MGHDLIVWSSCLLVNRVRASSTLGNPCEVRSRLVQRDFLLAYQFLNPTCIGLRSHSPDVRSRYILSEVRSMFSRQALPKKNRNCVDPSQKNPDKPILPAWVKRGAAIRLSLGRFRGQRSLNQRV